MAFNLITHQWDTPQATDKDDLPIFTGATNTVVQGNNNQAVVQKQPSTNTSVTNTPPATTSVQTLSPGSSEYDKYIASGRTFDNNVEAQTLAEQLKKIVAPPPNTNPLDTAAMKAESDAQQQIAAAYQTAAQAAQNAYKPSQLANNSYGNAGTPLPFVQGNTQPVITSPTVVVVQPTPSTQNSNSGSNSASPVSVNNLVGGPSIMDLIAEKVSIAGYDVPIWELGLGVLGVAIVLFNLDGRK